jgi:carbon storage regulator
MESERLVSKVYLSIFQGGNIVLVVTRKPGEKVIVGDDVVIQVVRVAGKKVRIGIQAPQSLSVYREEIRNAESQREEGRSVQGTGKFIF